jgi:mannose-1-phosphate guanylyltransferase
MKAMVLVAGKGTRVRPITNDIPKPMVPILGKPVMESILQLLHKHGIDDVMINTSFLSSVIEDYFQDGGLLDMEIGYSYEGQLEDGKLVGMALGSAGGMRKIQDFSGFFDETFIVLCGDAWIDLDVQSVLDFHRKKGGIATIVLQQVEWQEVSKYGVVELDAQQRILQFQEKPDQEEAISNMINTGIYIFEPEIFDYIPALQEFDIGSELFPALIANNVPFYGKKIDFQWVDIGSIPDVLVATKMALRGEIKGFKLPGKEIAPSIRTGINVKLNLDDISISGPVYIGSGTEIEKGVILEGPLMIGANCKIESGAHLKECLVDKYTRVSGLAKLDNKILFGKYWIDGGGEHLDVEDTDLSWLIDDSRSVPSTERTDIISSYQELLSEYLPASESD